MFASRNTAYLGQSKDAFHADTFAPKKMPLERLAHREARESLLLREMHHRMAVTLTLLVGVLWDEFRSNTMPGIRESLARCEARIVAFSRLHRFLLVGAYEGPIAVQKYVDSLCHALSEAVLKPLGVHCEVFVNASFLPAEVCERLGLVIAELVTNAARHAFIGRKDKVVRVELSGTSSSWHCIVSDNGSGVKASAPGVGSRVLEELIRPLGGRLAATSGPDGTSVAVTWSI
jgi:two-component sensor histidine kinase